MLGGAPCTKSSYWEMLHWGSIFCGDAYPHNSMSTEWNEEVGRCDSHASRFLKGTIPDVGVFTIRTRNCSAKRACECVYQCGSESKLNHSTGTPRRGCWADFDVGGSDDFVFYQEEVRANASFFDKNEGMKLAASVKSLHDNLLGFSGPCFSSPYDDINSPNLATVDDKVPAKGEDTLSMLPIR